MWPWPSSSIRICGSGSLLELSPSPISPALSSTPCNRCWRKPSATWGARWWIIRSNFYKNTSNVSSHTHIYRIILAFNRRGPAMPLVGHRHERIAEEIHHEVDIMLAGELRDPRLDIGMTVTEVRVGPDLKLARVYVDIEGTPEEQADALAGLEAAGGYIRHELCERIQIRRSPE